MNLKPAIVSSLCAMACICADAADIIPSPLHQGDKIAIITPGSAISDKSIDDAAAVLTEWGYTPVVMPYAKGRRVGSYAADDSTRAAEITAAFSDPDIKAIMCSRGGFGVARLLPLIDTETIRNNPKWLIGYSDISLLHALIGKAGVASIHGPMCDHIAGASADDIPTQSLRAILAGETGLRYDIKPHPHNIAGSVEGIVKGGNFIVLNNLASTPYDMLDFTPEDECILFVEEVDEKIHAVERMLIRLHQSGSLKNAKALIFGSFTGYKTTDDFNTMEDMIHTRLTEWGYYDEANRKPIVYRFPVGHTDDNYPMIEGMRCRLTVTDDNVTLEYLPE